MPRQWVFVGIIAATGIVLVSCITSKENEEPGGDHVVGEYILVSVNEQPLPTRVYDDGTFTQDILRGSLSLTVTGLAHFTTEHQTTARGGVLADVDTASGMYTQSGDSLVVQLLDSGVLTLTRDGNALVTLIDSFVFRYERTSS